MLVLSRKRNEEIVIDGRIRVKVLGFKGGRVRLGVCAPSDVSVNRAEVETTTTKTVESFDRPVRRKAALLTT